jgi:hypothetical protein
VPGAAPDRLARLEQEVVELREMLRPGAMTQGAVPPQGAVPVHGAGDPTHVQTPVYPPTRQLSADAMRPPSAHDATRVQAPVPSPAPPPTRQLSADAVLAPSAHDATLVHPPVPPTRIASAPARGSAPVAPPPLAPVAEPPSTGPEPVPATRPARGTGPRRGRGLTYLGVVVLLLCWVVWSAMTLVHGASPVDPAIGLGLALLGTVVAFWGSRLAGRLLLGARQRASAFPSHLLAGGFAAGCGLALLSVTPFSMGPVQRFLLSLLPF